ncbi:MAG: restriction endonuclease subunit S domain-containing protein [Deltaproteobacteria bacterium]
MEELMDSHLRFTISRKDLVDRFLIPKFYDPDLEEAARLANSQFDLPRLADVLGPGKSGSQLGVWLPRENYGTGEIPYVRTSDLFHWRIRPDFKKGVSAEVYEEYASRVDVKEDDILMVAHGTYLVGDLAIVEASDLPVLLQDHMLRLRVRSGAGVHPHLLLAALSTGFVRRQVRARQFSAEIIDKIGDRYLGLRIPIPRSPKVREKVIGKVGEVIAHHSDVRTTIQKASTVARAPGPRAGTHLGFTHRRSTLVNRILIPRYYDPELEADLKIAERADGAAWIPLGQLVDDGTLKVSTGVEVGKMAYGTGAIPFIRTSDLVDWELFRDPTQGVSEAVSSRYNPKGVLQEDDVVLVRDGTYLVGSSALVLKEDLPALFCGGLYRLRVAKKKPLGPHALLGLLNLPLVRRQMRCKQFTRDVIDTLGPRLLEVRVPPPGCVTAKVMEQDVQRVMSLKGAIKALMDEAIGLLEPDVPASAVGRPGWAMR